MWNYKIYFQNVYNWRKNKELDGMKFMKQKYLLRMIIIWNKQKKQKIYKIKNKKSNNKILPLNYQNIKN